MYAITFDLKIEDLKTHYGEQHNKAYDEIRQELETLGFEWIQENFYINNYQENTLTTVYKAINRLSQIDWFKKSVRDVRAFKVEDWSDFTDIVKELNVEKINEFKKRKIDFSDIPELTEEDFKNGCFRNLKNKN